MDYSSFSRWCSNSIEELANELTEEVIEELRKEIAGASLQTILSRASPQDILDFLSYTSKKRASLKKFGPQNRRVRLMFDSLLLLQQVQGILQEVESLRVDEKGVDVFESFLHLRDSVLYPKLKHPALIRQEYAESLPSFLL
jgi:hypothetical protein